MRHKTKKSGDLHGCRMGVNDHWKDYLSSKIYSYLCIVDNGKSPA
jgi:hypothetical protein